MTRYKTTPSRRGWKFTEKDFDTAKQLLKLDLTVGTVAKATGWGKATIGRAAMSETYLDYTTLTQSYTAKKPVVEVTAPEISEQSAASLTHSSKISAADIRTLTATDPVERIANALERLADAWESAPKKKGIFS